MAGGISASTGDNILYGTDGYVTIGTTDLGATQDSISVEWSVEQYYPDIAQARGPVAGTGRVIKGEFKIKDGEAGAGADKLYIGVPNDRGAAIRPGLNKELWDASVAFSDWCNEQGGIGGLQIEPVDLDGRHLPDLGARGPADLAGGGAEVLGPQGAHAAELAADGGVPPREDVGPVEAEDRGIDEVRDREGVGEESIEEPDVVGRVEAEGLPDPVAGEGSPLVGRDVRIREPVPRRPAADVRTIAPSVPTKPRPAMPIWAPGSRGRRRAEK